MEVLGIKEKMYCLDIIPELVQWGKAIILENMPDNVERPIGKNAEKDKE